MCVRVRVFVRVCACTYVCENVCVREFLLLGVCARTCVYPPCAQALECAHEGARGRAPTAPLSTLGVQNEYARNTPRAGHPYVASPSHLNTSHSHGVPRTVFGISIAKITDQIRSCQPYNPLMASQVPPPLGVRGEKSQYKCALHTILNTDIPLRWVRKGGEGPAGSLSQVAGCGARLPRRCQSCIKLYQST